MATDEESAQCGLKRFLRRIASMKHLDKLQIALEDQAKILAGIKASLDGDVASPQAARPKVAAVA